VTAAETSPSDCSEVEARETACRSSAVVAPPVAAAVEGASRALIVCAREICYKGVEQFAAVRNVDQRRDREDDRSVDNAPCLLLSA
jgi:hypothetical protein